MIDRLLEEIKDFNLYDGEGLTSKCYYVGDYALLYGSIELDAIELRKILIDKYISQGVHIAPIIEYKADPNEKINTYDKGNSTISYQKGWTLQKRAKGSVIYKNWTKDNTVNSIERFDEQIMDYCDNLNDYMGIIRKIANAKQEQLDRFVYGNLKLAEREELVIDYSKPTNFFYDEEEGFTFIDIGVNHLTVPNEFTSPEWTTRSVVNLLTPSLPYLVLHQENYRRHGVGESTNGLLPADIHLEITSYITEIINKLRTAFFNNNISMDIFNKVLSERLESFDCLNRVPKYNNKEELYEAVKSKLNLIISSNLDNPNLKDDSGVVKIK